MPIARHLVTVSLIQSPPILSSLSSMSSVHRTSIFFFFWDLSHIGYWDQLSLNIITSSPSKGSWRLWVQYMNLGEHDWVHHIILSRARRMPAKTLMVKGKQTKLVWCLKPGIPARETEVPGPQVQEQPGLQSEFKANLSNLVRTCLKNKK